MAKITLTDLANLQNENSAVASLSANNAAIEAAIENTLSRDGTSPNQMGDNIDMNSHRVINLPAPVSVTEPLRLSDLNTFIGGGTIQAIPSGGTTGQVLTKSSNSNYAVDWETTSGQGDPIVVLVSGQSFLTAFSSLAWSPATNLKIWNFSGVDGNVGTAYAAPSASTISLPIGYLSRIAKDNPSRSVYGIVVGFSSRDISHWLSGTGAPDIYQNILNQMTPALAAAGVTKITRFVWMQGQADCLPLNTSYVANFTTMMGRFWGNSWFPKETRSDIFSIASVADGDPVNTDADRMNDLLLAVVNAMPDTRRYFYLSTFTGATYWDAVALGHPTAQGIVSMSQLTGRSNLNGVTNDPFTGNVAVGTAGSVSASKFAINASANPVMLTPITGALSQIQGVDGGVAYDTIDTIGNPSSYIGRRANGISTALTTLAANDLITGLAARGYDGTAFSGAKSSILFFASEIWTTIHRGTYISVYNTPTATDVAAEGARFQPSGGLSVGAAAIAVDPGIGNVNAAGSIIAASATAIPAGGTTGTGLKVSSTANFGVFFGSGAPSLSAAKGSLYMRSDGSSTSTRMYVNTDGGTTWTNVVTAA